MSLLPFSEATNKTGMYELFQRLTITNPTSYDAYKFATDANLAYADYAQLAIGSSSKWQWDDDQQVKYPELKVDLISGQFDYPFTTDSESTPNQILDIERVEMATDSAGANFVTLEAYDEMDDDSSIVLNRTVSGIPYRYSKRANGIFLDPTPNFNCTTGIRIFISRMPVYFLGTDTTKVAGIPDDHKAYLVYKAAYMYCVIKQPQLANGYLTIVRELEDKIKSYYSRRNRDEHKNLSMEAVTFM